MVRLIKVALEFQALSTDVFPTIEEEHVGSWLWISDTDKWKRWTGVAWVDAVRV